MQNFVPREFSDYNFFFIDSIETYKKVLNLTTSQGQHTFPKTNRQLNRERGKKKNVGKNMTVKGLLQAFIQGQGIYKNRILIGHKIFFL